MLTIALEQQVLLHARPAAIIAAVAKEYESVVLVSAGTQIADAKDPLSLMRLGCKQGIELLADGSDEQAALDAVAAVMRKV